MMTSEKAIKYWRRFLSEIPEIDRTIQWDEQERQEQEEATRKAITALNLMLEMESNPKQAKWIIRCNSHQDFSTGEVDEEFYIECSECHRKVWEISADAIISSDYQKILSDYPYCHCGAKMLMEEDS
jgi:hypothetical protein